MEVKGTLTCINPQDCPHWLASWTDPISRLVSNTLTVEVFKVNAHLSFCTITEEKKVSRCKYDHV
jgi:hypothetical protein